jgi:hypothetical protein
MISNFHVPLPYKVKVREISAEQVEKLLKAEEDNESISPRFKDTRQPN